MDSTDHLGYLERERSKRTFNMGDYNIRVTPENITVRGKTPETWGKETVLDRARARARIHTESRTPVFVFYIAYPVYAFGFLMFFLTTGISIATQITIFGVALLLMFTPLLMDLVLSTRRFLVAAATFFVVIFSLSSIQPFTVTFKAVESSVGKGHVEMFIIFASIFPVLLRRMISQMMIRYRLVLEDGNTSFETETESPAAPALIGYLRYGRSPRRSLRLPFHLLTLSRKRMKSCVYCGRLTLDECKRCHRPICPEHTETLRGFKVCLDCFVERRGKVRHVMR